jgi:hypothetical protein
MEKCPYSPLLNWQLDWVFTHLPGHPKSGDIVLVMNFHHFAKILFDHKFLFFEKNHPKKIFFLSKSNIVHNS